MARPQAGDFWHHSFLCCSLLQCGARGFRQVAQTLFTSQIAFIIIILLTLTFDSIAESSVRTLLLGEPFTCVATLSACASPHGRLVSGLHSFVTVAPARSPQHFRASRRATESR